LSFVREDERSLVLSATARLAASGGYGTLTVARIRAAAGVSRKAFDAHFDGVESCFLDAVEQLATRAVEDAARAGSAADSWPAGVYRAVASFCGAAARDPLLPQLAFVEILALGSSGLRRRELLISMAAEQLRGSAPRGFYPSDLGAEASVGATWDAIHHQVAAGRTTLLSQMAPTLSFLLLAPAIGAPAATAAIQSAGPLNEPMPGRLILSSRAPASSEHPTGRLGAS
jgi:AcrR family transcriptional regulator